jgi:integrase
LDKEVAALRQHTFATATKRAYTSHLQAFLSFCVLYNATPIPVATKDLCRYITWLARTRTYTTVKQYITVIKLIHLEAGFNSPFHNNHPVTSLLTALKRKKGAASKYKLAIPLEKINQIRKHLDLTNIRDAQTWAIVTCGFYGMLRISSMTVADPSTPRFLQRKDIAITPHGCSLTFSFSKTIQFHERLFTAVLPHLAGLPTCPTQALINFYRQAGTHIPSAAPALAYYRADGSLAVPTPASARAQLLKAFLAVGLSAQQYSAHSLRRGGASHLLALQVPISVIRVLGDWKSDVIFRYLIPPVLSKVRLAKNVFSTVI